MPLTPDFTVAQLSNLTSVLVTDTSTGSDAAIVDRRIEFQEYDGSFLVPPNTLTDYVPFPLSDGSIVQIDNLLDKSYALNIIVQWLDSGDVILYQKTIIQGFSAAAKYGLYQLTQYQIPSRTNLLQISNYRISKLTVWDAVLSGDNAILYASDIANAQRCYDDATYILSHPELFR